MFSETGRIVYLSDLRTGISTRNGEEWVAKDVVIETNDRYPRKVAATITNRNWIEAANLQLGEVVTVCIEPSAHEYNGNWYTDMRVVDVLQNNLSRFVTKQL